MAQQLSDFGKIAANLNTYVVRPINAFGVGGFVFDIEGESTVNLTAEITDHFVEDATTIQDHIAVKPKKVILKSYVGELVYRQDPDTDTFIQKAVQKLTVVNEYLPTLTDMAQQVLDLRQEREDSPLSLDNLGNIATSKTINRISDYWAFVKNMMPELPRQQQAYMYFKSLINQKILVSVQTPFEFMNKMAIESITAIQPEGSKYISDFSITLKEIRTAQILSPLRGTYGRQITRNEDWAQVMSQRAAQQTIPSTNQGNVQGLEITEDDFLPLDVDQIYEIIK